MKCEKKNDWILTSAQRNPRIIVNNWIIMLWIYITKRCFQEDAGNLWIKLIHSSFWACFLIFVYRPLYPLLLSVVCRKCPSPRDLRSHHRLFLLVNVNMHSNTEWRQSWQVQGWKSQFPEDQIKDFLWHSLKATEGNRQVKERQRVHWLKHKHEKKTSTRKLARMHEYSNNLPQKYR